MNRKGYKHTSLGWIPEDWEVKKCGEAARVQGGYAFDSSKFIEKGKYQVVKMSNLYGGILDLNRSASFVDNLSRQEAEYLLQKGDILLTLTGTVGKRDYGYTYLIDDETDLLLNQRVARLFVDETKADRTYLYYQFKNVRVLDQFFFSARGGTGNQANVGTSDVELIKIPFPPISEQRLIGAILSTLDFAIVKENRLISALQIRHRGLMQQLLSGKKRLKGFRDDWGRHGYGELLNEIKRPVSWNEDQLYRLISVRRRSGGIFEREAIYGHQIKVKDLRTVCTGDFLFSKMQIVHGASALVTEEFNGAKISGSYIAVVSNDKKKLDIQYFNLYSQLPYFYQQTFVSSFGVHIEKMTFDFEAFLSLEMTLPPLNEQIAIVKVLKASDNEIQLHRSRLAALQQQKKGLMQVLLTGKIRVKPKDG